MTQPTIAVVGAGAIGGVMAAALGDLGRNLTLCVRTRFDRLSRIHRGAERRYPHSVVTSIEGLEPVDWVLLCTKTYQLAAAAPWLEVLVGPNTRIAVMQNGVDHVERMTAFAPPARVVPAIILLPARVHAPGVVEQSTPGVIKVPDTQAAHALAKLFAGHDLVRVEPSADFVSEVWKKLVVNAAGGAICALTLTPIREFSHPLVRDLALTMVREIVAVGRAEGASIDDAFIEDAFRQREGAHGEHWSSIAVDWREGRPMEWEARNAVVGKIGRKHGIATPFNDALSSLLALADAKGGKFERG